MSILFTSNVQYLGGTKSFRAHSWEKRFFKTFRTALEVKECVFRHLNVLSGVKSHRKNDLEINGL